MHDDERAIRQLVSAWMEATRAGDVEAVLALMSDDVVFLTPGRPPMGKADFAAAARAGRRRGAALRRVERDRRVPGLGRLGVPAPAAERGGDDARRHAHGAPRPYADVVREARRPLAAGARREPARPADDGIGTRPQAARRMAGRFAPGDARAAIPRMLRPRGERVTGDAAPQATNAGGRSCDEKTTNGRRRPRGHGERTSSPGSCVRSASRPAACCWCIARSAACGRSRTGRPA